MFVVKSIHIQSYSFENIAIPDVIRMLSTRVTNTRFVQNNSALGALGLKNNSAW